MIQRQTSAGVRGSSADSPSSESLPDGSDRDGHSSKQGNKPGRRREKKRRRRRRSRGAYLSTNCYIVVDTAVKKRERVRGSKGGKKLKNNIKKKKKGEK